MRYFWTFLRSLCQPKQDVFDTFRLPLIVWPWNCDALNFHLNNGDYIYLCDMGRMQLTCNSNLLKVFWKLKTRPVVGGLKVRFIKSLLPFQRFFLQTQIKSWDEKWIYIEHTLIRKEKIYARVYIQACFKVSKGILPIEKLIETLGKGPLTPPTLPPEWNFKLAR